MLTFSKLVVLVAEDQAELRAIIKAFLQRMGVRTVLEAVNGSDALQRLRIFPLENNGRLVDLMLIDWNMPVINGLQVLKAVRASEKYCTTPVIMVTAESDREAVLLARNEGVNGYIVKPFQENELERKVTEVMEQHPLALPKT